MSMDDFITEPRSVKNTVTADAMHELRELLPKGIAVNAAWAKNKNAIQDILYTLFVSGEETGDQDGYDRGYDEGLADAEDDA